MPRFDSQRDAEMRLNGTILSYDGRVIKVQGIAPRLRIAALFLRDREEQVIDQDDPLLSFIPPTLGYINHEEGASFAMRQPARRYKQGLDLRAVYFADRMRAVARHDDMFFLDCLENRYPNLERAIQRLQGGTNPFKQSVCRSAAFSKKFAVGRGAENLRLLHKGREVGHFEGNVPVLADRYSYLQECLDEAVAA